MPNVTMKQIAQRVGLHQSTVSRVLNGERREQWESMAERAAEVRRVATEMGYRPNTAARATRKGRTGALALLASMSGFTSYLPWGLLRGLNLGAATKDLILQFAQLPDRNLTDETFIPKALREMSADGFIVDYTHHIPGRMMDLIRQHHLPAVWLNTKQDRDCVYPDDETAGYNATKHLLQLGHRRIAYIDYQWGPVDPRPLHYSAIDRVAGYTRAMTEAGLVPRVLREDRGVESTRRAQCSLRHLSSEHRPTAVVTYSAEDAQAVLTAGLRLGLHCPRDLSVITFGYNLAWFDAVRITMLGEPQEQLGVAAVETAVKKIEDPQRDLPPRVVPFLQPSGTSVAALA